MFSDQRVQGSLPQRRRRRNVFALALGVMLVLTATVGSFLLIQSFDRTVEVYSAPRVLLPGEQLRLADLAIVSVRLDDALPRYLVVEDTVTDPTTIGYVLERSIGVGELIPISALSQRSARTTSVVLPLANELATALGPGQLVDIWATGDARDDFALPPRILVSKAIIAAIPEDEVLLSGSYRDRVEVLVPHVSVARVLAAINSDEAITVLQSEFRD